MSNEQVSTLRPTTARTTKSLLAASLISLALGFTGVAWGFGMPLAAIFFGLFLISKILGKEAALFDEEHARSITLAEAEIRKAAANAPKQQSDALPFQGQASKARS